MLEEAIFWMTWTKITREFGIQENQREGPWMLNEYWLQTFSHHEQKSKTKSFICSRERKKKKTSIKPLWQISLYINSKRNTHIFYLLFGEDSYSIPFVLETAVKGCREDGGEGGMEDRQGLKKGLWVAEVSLSSGWDRGKEF